MEPEELQKLKKYALLLVVALALLIAGFWVSNHGYITAELPEGSSGETTYILVKQGEGESTTVVTKDGKLNKLVGRGTYEVTAFNDEQTGFSVVKTKGFFGRSSANVSLAPESSRRFIGSGTVDCMYYSGDILYSYDCNGGFKNVTIHLPASSTQPSFTVKNIEGVDGSIEGIAKTASGPVLLLGYAQGGDFVGASHTAYILSSGIQTDESAVLAGLSADKQYRLAAYRSGFIVYDTSFESVKYYSSITATPEDINIARPGDKNIKPYLLGVSGDSIFIVYSDKADFEINDNPEAIGKIKTSVSVYNGGSTKQLSFDRRYDEVELCGTNKLCALNTIGEQRLYVFDIASDTPKQNFGIEGISKIASISKQLLAVRGGEILEIDADNAGGHVSYSFGDYSFCGLQTEGKRYLLCIGDNTGRAAVLLVDTDGASDGIDKKVSALLKLPEVAAVSPYGNYVFVSAHLGELVYDSKLNSLVPDPAVKRAAVDAINAAAADVGFDFNAYSLVIAGG